MTPRQVSVVVPSYNAAWSIRDTLLSVFAQTFSDFDVIVVNDGSTDNLMDVLSTFSEREKRLRVISQANMGLAAARNRGLSEVRTPFVAFLDSDDIWHPDFLACLLPSLQREVKAPFAYAHSLRIDADNRIIPSPRWTHAPRHDFEGLLTVNSVGNGSAAMFRTAVIRELGGFDTTLRARDAQGAEDWKLCLQLAARHAPVLVDRYLVCYRLMEDSMSQKRPARQLHAIRTVMDDIREEFPDAGTGAFRNARTMMNGWLMPAFFRKREFKTILRLLIQSYVLNPFWFASRDLREVHLHKIASLVSDRRPRAPLSEFVENGMRPFSFLGPDHRP
jgi:glycosyltransferase involved in cell wall biosynthesis